MAVSKHDERYAFVPKALWGKFPNTWILMLEKSTRITIEVAMLLLSFLIHYATFFAPPNYTGNWVLFLTASLGPAIFAISYIAWPFNPYRSMAAAREGMKNLDRSDHDAKALVALLGSSEARRFSLKLALKLSLLLVTPMIIISIAIKRTPVWRFSADCLVGIPVFFFIGLFILFRMEILAWVLGNWMSDDGNC